MDAGRVRLRHMRRDPRVAVSVIDAGNWYRQVSLPGRVAELYDDTDRADIDRLAIRYTAAAHTPTGPTRAERLRGGGELERLGSGAVRPVEGRSV